MEECLIIKLLKPPTLLVISSFPGGLILADRGFTCDEYARMSLAEVKTPPFTKGRKQLEKIDVDWSHELSVVRIHVERVLKLSCSIIIKFNNHDNNNY